jgi:predicted DNA-binding transcriptional regulator AlpA
MIATAQADYPQLSLRQLCVLLGVSRAWYYARQQEDRAAQAEATRLRDAIERLVLAFPG